MYSDSDIVSTTGLGLHILTQTVQITFSGCCWNVWLHTRDVVDYANMQAFVD